MKAIIKKLAGPLLCGIVTLLTFHSALFIGYVPTASMEPTIQTGSYILGHRFIGEVQRGDILAFEHGGSVLVKRVAAVPGDTVYIDDTQLAVSVNAEAPNYSRIVTVPDNCYFMLGDNGDNSIDSRYWSNPLVPSTQVVAKIWT